MATSWITGVCVQQNRLEWTVLRRAKESWEVADQGDDALVRRRGKRRGRGRRGDQAVH
jgi:hypothetical protein